MKRMWKILPVLVATLASGCVHDYHARLTTTEVIRTARRAAELKGYNLEDYREPAVSYKQGNWLLIFVGRLPVPGADLIVEVDDTAGKTQVTGGM
jgi:hypothetical protein